jgi:signal transduction histidine kinase
VLVTKSQNGSVGAVARVASPRVNLRWIAAGGRSVWMSLSLSLRFSLAASIVVVVGMLVIGKWVAERIETGVIGNASLITASYVENAIAPHLQELAAGARLSEVNQRALDKLLSFEATSKPILAFRIWQGNTVVYGNRREELGKAFPLTTSMRRALNGEVVGELEYLSDEHSPGHAARGAPVLEIYAPVYQQGTNRIIAVAETYEINIKLRQELTRAQIESWVVVGLVTFAIVGALFGIVHNGSRTIERQSVDLERRIEELTALLEENNSLRLRVRQANQRVAENHERLLRSVGADLHDGPVQLLGLAILKLEEFRELVEDSNKALLEGTDAPDIMHSVLTETLQEIRNLSAGLAPPDIERLSICDSLIAAAKKHERRTGTHVAFEVERFDVAMPFPIRTCLYRFVQEGLNNAYQHAGGIGQVLRARRSHDAIEVEVQDSGPGFVPVQSNLNGMGLNGLRDRIESLGGHFKLCTENGRGTRLSVRFECGHKEQVL